MVAQGRDDSNLQGGKKQKTDAVGKKTRACPTRLRAIDGFHLRACRILDSWHDDFETRPTRLLSPTTLSSSTNGDET